MRATDDARGEFVFGLSGLVANPSPHHDSARTDRRAARADAHQGVGKTADEEVKLAVPDLTEFENEEAFLIKFAIKVVQAQIAPLSAAQLPRERRPVFAARRRSIRSAAVSDDRPR